MQSLVRLDILAGICIINRLSVARGLFDNDFWVALDLILGSLEKPLVALNNIWLHGFVLVHIRVVAWWPWAQIIKVAIENSSLALPRALGFKRMLRFALLSAHLPLIRDLMRIDLENSRFYLCLRRLPHLGSHSDFFGHLNLPSALLCPFDLAWVRLFLAMEETACCTGEVT